MTYYDRADVLRILRITNRQIQGWEKAGLIPASESYSFFDLLQIKKLRDLRAKHVRSEVIRKSLAEMRLASGMANPLIEASFVERGSRLAFRHSGRAVEPLTGQFVMDFADRGVISVEPCAENLRVFSSPDSINDLFAKGVALEEDPQAQQEAIKMYMRVLELDPQHAAAQINLGTLFYNRQDFAKAEQFYRQAIASDPRYALAYFDLGNVLDETGRLPEAVKAYSSALLLAPTYADAHYNLALAFEKLKLARKALRHWQTYVRLDPVGPWAVHARNQIRKILRGEGLTIVYRRRQP